MIKIGIIGMNAGNGHPYSWSAIINGFFDGREITEGGGYPGITAYLEANKDTVGINEAQVTHVWTQERAASESVAKAAGIDFIVDKMESMIGQVDAVILSRDDAENHVQMAKPFIDAGIPIFIDKPLAIHLNDLNYFREQQALGKLIMSCSSMRYSNECRVAKTELHQIGQVELVTAVSTKGWPRYGIHMLEALFMILEDPTPLTVTHVGSEKKDTVYIEFHNGIKATIHCFMDIAPTFQISLFGQKSWRLIEIKNSYSMFRENIIEFIRSVQEGKSRLPFHKTANVIRTLIAGKESLEQGGKKIIIL
ncbi:MAG: Gfo/Idh/MocA family oxidoreductase [Chitinophagaceae bacterium]